MQKSIDDGIGDLDTSLSYDANTLLSKTKSVCSDDESQKTLTVVSTESNTDTKTSPQDTPDKYFLSSSTRNSNSNSNSDTKSHAHVPAPIPANDDPMTISQSSDEFTVAENGLIMVPESHPEHLNLLRLQLENYELMQWKHRLQRRIQNERAEITKLKAVLSAKHANSNSIPSSNQDFLNSLPDGNNYERVVAQYVLENTLLEQKKNYLAKEIFEENQKLIQLQVELAVRQFQI